MNTGQKIVASIFTPFVVAILLETNLSILSIPASIATSWREMRYLYDFDIFKWDESSGYWVIVLLITGVYEFAIWSIAEKRDVNNVSTDVTTSNESTGLPKKHMFMSIISTLLCCATGLYSLYCSLHVAPSIASGNYSQAFDYSNKAFKWSKYGLYIYGVLAFLLLITTS